MSLSKIVKLGHPVLRKKARMVSGSEIQSATIQKIIDDMIETMRCSDGVGIAAPQINRSKRIIAIEVKKDNPRYPNQTEIPLTILINPKILSYSRELVEVWEGCLSLPDLKGIVPRWGSIVVRGIDCEGKTIELKLSDFFARIVQHEIDHLNGQVFIDRMKDLSTLTYQNEFQKYWKKDAS